MYQPLHDISVFCIIDSTVYYECRKFEDGMADVLMHILGRMEEDSRPAAVKVLVTSLLETALVRVAFDGELILSMKALPRLCQDRARPVWKGS